MQRLLKRFTLAASLAALSLTASASPASAAVTIGQLAPGIAPPDLCSNSNALDIVQASVNSGNPYVVPSTVATGTLTAWSHNASSTAGRTMALKIWRKVADPLTFQVMGHDGPRQLAPGTLNTFTGLSLPVKAGDILGGNKGTGANACAFTASGESGSYTALSNVADGGTQSTWFTGNTDFRMNMTAVIEPTNAFTFGATSRNKKKGTATLTINVPNPGNLTGSGKGVKVAGAAGAVISKKVTAPGKVKLTIRAKGKKKQTLNETGKVKVKPKVSYTPTGGVRSTRSTKLKLKKN